MLDFVVALCLVVVLYGVFDMHRKLTCINNRDKVNKYGNCQVIIHDFEKLKFINDCISNLKSAKKSEELVLQGVDTSMLDMKISHERDELLKQKGALRAS